MRVAVIDTGTANLASMLAALRRIGAETELTREPEVVRDAPLVVLPGVGAFGAGMARLNECNLTEAIAARVRGERPFLAVCLGLQMLCLESEETPGVAGIGVLATKVRRFADLHEGARVTVPQLGWNEIVPRPDATLLSHGYAYYANSYYLASIPEGWTGAETEHGVRLVAALERGPMLACQFHPELSGPFGHDLLHRWLARGAAC